jgi:DNA processing protein
MTGPRHMAEPAEDVLLARAYLNRVAEPASLALWDWVRRLRPIDAARTVRAGDAPPDVAGQTKARRRTADPQADLDAAERLGIRLVTPESADWPHLGLGALERVALERVSNGYRPSAVDRERGEAVPPLALWVRGAGDLPALGLRSVAIVGARAASAYGEHVAALFAYGLAGHGITVVSGGAYGIDAAAHRAAIGGEGSTVIVSAGGMDRPYPVAHARLYDQVLERGLVISESPPGCAPQRHRFLSRNRLIAALSTGTVVVEAARRSGALNTAAHCVTLGRPLMVVPGPVTSAMSVGCHNLLRRDDYGALLVGSVADVLAVVGGIGEGQAAAEQLEFDTAPDSSTRSAFQRTLDGLDPIAKRVFDGLSARTRLSEDELSVRSGVSTIDVIRALPALRLAGLIDTDGEGYRISAAYRSQPAK